ncbi:hypothetical protein CPB84DRAFT_1817009 [Gymnopilus junonius]|uniref:Alpha-1,4 glucan phosphorylase n=1 Tax=Gymnopilus junonius TaxID=109634 RepID=A0A9P5NGN8_GYMJU|nr:hypothetical protein CPB84DRAFT_1817009 [Gymnopilus junonius]
MTSTIDPKTIGKPVRPRRHVHVKDITKSFVNHVQTSLARQAYNLDDLGAYQAAALAARDDLLVKWSDTQMTYMRKAPKRAYYLSLEFLMGRTLDNALLNLGLKDKFREGIDQLGFNIEDILDKERDAGLGNGGLGRLAACYLDSSSSQELPLWGYGLRYKYGIFQQLISPTGEQLENPWELPRLDVTFDIRFYGHAERLDDGSGRAIWAGGQEVLAMAYDVMIPGYNTPTTNNLRLWETGNYEGAVDASNSAQAITAVLYPNDHTSFGKELRLKQQYFWTAASLADIMRRFKNLGKGIHEFPDYVAIQLNDEALEKWPVPMVEQVLPRFFLQEEFPGDREKLARMSLIEEGVPKQVRMANLAASESHGQCELVRTTILKDFVGNVIMEVITPRRWLDQLDKRPPSFAENKKFRTEWALSNSRTLGFVIRTDAFDVQIKRIHEYKRQTLNILELFTYAILTLKNMTPAERKKAAPAYYIAKLTIRLIVNVARDYLQLYFLPDYSVSLAEILIPASDISQLFRRLELRLLERLTEVCLNGGLLLGMLVYGANIEIAEEVGESNVVMLANDLRYQHLYHPIPVEEKSPALANVLHQVSSGAFGDSGVMSRILLSTIRQSDYYLITDDFDSYIAALAMVDEAYLDKDEWVKKSIRTTAKMGKFSSDRAINEYAESYWNIEPLKNTGHARLKRESS